MSSPITVAAQLSVDYFNLNQSSYRKPLSDDVVLSVSAEICEPGQSPKHFDASFEGKATVVEILALRHFDITSKCVLKKLDFTPLKENSVKVDFKSIETKKEAKHKDPITYMYTGHYELALSKDLKVTKIDLYNRREIYNSET